MSILMENKINRMLYLLHVDITQSIEGLSESNIKGEN